MVNEQRKRVGSVVILGVAVYMVVALIRNLMDFSGLDSRVDEIDHEVDKLRDENERLKNMSERVNTQEFEEFSIREKLGMVKPGEVVVLLPNEYLDKKTSELEGGNGESELVIPVWQKWLKLFWRWLYYKSS